MRATAVDTLPGGFLDLLRAASPPLPGLDDLVAGRAQQAVAALGTAPPTPAAAWWRHLAEHTALLGLPDGSALFYDDPLDPRPPWPRKPDDPPAGHPEAPLVRLLGLATFLRELRGMLPPVTSPEVSSPASLAKGVLRQLDEVRAEVAPGWQGLLPHLTLLAADILARGGDPRADAVLAEAWQAFDAGDGRGACSVVAGDWLAAPFATPITWGFSLARPTSDDSAIPASIEDPEQAPPVDAARAVQAYDAAEAHYTATGNLRGTAVVAWRRAYLQHAVGRPDLAAQEALEAAVRLDAAGEAGCAVVARAHAVLAGLADARLPTAAEVAAPVVAWGRSSSLAHAMGIGSLFVRAGRHWSRADRRPERAMAAFAIAEAVWAGLDRPGSRSQTLADQAKVMSGIGARQAALVYVTRAVDVDSRPLREPADPMDVRRQRAALLAAQLYNIANATGDVDGMERAQQELARVAAPLRRGDPGWTADQRAMSEQLLGLVGTLSQTVMGKVFRAHRARDAGDDEGAARYFADAEAALAHVPDEDAGLLRAMVLGFQHRKAEAAAAYRPWLAARLAGIAAARAQNPGAVVAELLDQLERQTRGQSLFFGLRFDDAALAREQFDALHATREPWWAGLGTAWEHEEAHARLLEAEGDLDGAATVFDRAVAAVERVRTELGRDDLRQAFGADSTVQQVYRNAARVRLRLHEAAVARHDPTAAATEAVAALRLMEQARNRALADLMTPAPGTAAPSDGDSLDGLLQAWRGAGAEAALAEDRLAAALRADPPAPARVADRRRDLDAARAALAAREAELRARDERYWRLTAGTGSQPDPASVLPQLPSGHVVLVYSLDRPDFLACGVDAGGVVATHWSRDERRIGPLADRLVDACRRGALWEDLAARLADILLAPLATALDGASTVHVVASGPTLRVPFAVLPWRGRPLGFQADVSMLPSLSAYPLLGSASTVGPALVVGDPAAMSYRRSPDDPPQPQPPLPAAAVEAAAVARVFGVRPLLGREATEARVRTVLPGVRIAHLATHGVVDPDSPRASAVLLADGEQITVAELMGMRISADLVVLSACETGTGRPAGGDEMLGLGRGLLAAGARSALVTLWPVLDTSAALLMTRFHEEVAGGASTPAALRTAARWLAGLDRKAARERLKALRDDALVARLPDGWASTVRGAVTDAARVISRSPEVTMPYSHPRHWAPYVLLGR